MKTNPTQCFTKKNEFGFALFGGPGGIRTLDLSDANRTLSQLSYGPLCYCGTLRLPQNADLLRRCRTIYGKSAYRFHYITPCGKNQDFLRIFVPDFGECSAWRESAAWQGEPYFLFGGEYEIYAACYDVRETHCPLGIV